MFPDDVTEEVIRLLVQDAARSVLLREQGGNVMAWKRVCILWRDLCNRVFHDVVDATFRRELLLQNPNFDVCASVLRCVSAKCASEVPEPEDGTTVLRAMELYDFNSMPSVFMEDTPFLLDGCLRFIDRHVYEEFRILIVTRRSTEWESRLSQQARPFVTVTSSVRHAIGPYNYLIWDLPSTIVRHHLQTLWLNVPFSEYGRGMFVLSTKLKAAVLFRTCFYHIASRSLNGMYAGHFLNHEQLSCPPVRIGRQLVDRAITGMLRDEVRRAYPRLVV